MSTRLMRLRKRLGFTLEGLADAAGLTKSYLSKVERGLSSPSIATALKLAAALDVNVEQLFADGAASGARYNLVRASARRAFGDTGSGITYSTLADDADLRRILPFVIYPELEFTDTALKEHGGEEFIFVHSGSIEVDLEGERVVLETGDSLHFSAKVPHRIRSLGSEKSEVLVTVVSDD